MVIHPKDDETLFNQVEEIANSWLGTAKFAYSSIENAGNFAFSTTEPSLTSNDNGSYLLVVGIDTSSYVMAVGYALLDGITGDAPVESEDFELTNSNTPLTGKLTGNVVTLTVTNEEYTLPTTITSVTVGSDSLTADTDYVYDAVAGTITLNTDKEGKVTVAASATQYIGMIDATKVTFGDDGMVKVDNTALTANDTIIYLNTTVGVEALLKTFKKDMAIADVKEAMGIGENDSTNVVAGDTAIKSPTNEDAPGPEYILVIKLTNSKLVSAGVVKNTSAKTGS